LEQHLLKKSDVPSNQAEEPGFSLWRVCCTIDGVKFTEVKDTSSSTRLQNCGKQASSINMLANKLLQISLFQQQCLTSSRLAILVH